MDRKNWSINLRMTFAYTTSENLCLFIKNKNISWHNQDCLEEKTQEWWFKNKDKPERHFGKITSKYNA